MGLRDFSRSPCLPPRLIVRLVGEVIAAAEAECKEGVLDVVFCSPTFLAPFRLHFLVPSHQFPAVATRPVCLLAEDSWIGLVPLLTDIFPLRSVVKAHAVNTRVVGGLLVRKVAMVHSKPPFWPPLFLGADCCYRGLAAAGAWICVTQTQLIKYSIFV